MVTKSLAWSTVISLLMMSDTMFGDPMNVSATVTGTCQFGAFSDVSFGDITGLFLTTTSTSSGSIVVTCTPTSGYELSIDAGANASATSRRMTDGSDFINYSLYQNMGYSTPWGDGTTFGNAQSDTGSGTAHTFTIYARIPSGQTPVAPGTYSDVVMINFNF